MRLGLVCGEVLLPRLRGRPRGEEGGRGGMTPAEGSMVEGNRSGEIVDTAGSWRTQNYCILAHFTSRPNLTAL